MKPLSIILNTDNGREQNVPAGGPPGGKGYAGNVTNDLTDVQSVAVRGEGFYDEDGFRTGTAQRPKKGTFTRAIWLKGGLILRPE